MQKKVPELLQSCAGILAGTATKYRDPHTACSTPVWRVPGQELRVALKINLTGPQTFEG